MNPGEYIGKDGRTYRWRRGDTRGWFVEELTTDGIWVISLVQPSTEDWPDAKAALDALIEAESMGWVAIDDNARIQADGSDPQVRHEGGICVWRALTNPIDKRWPKAYRKGREVALEEANHRHCEDCWYWPAIESHSATVTKMQARYNALAEAARELVEAVSGGSRCDVDYGGIGVNPAWFDYVVTAAKKVGAKL